MAKFCLSIDSINRSDAIRCLEVDDYRPLECHGDKSRVRLAYYE